MDKMEDKQVFDPAFQAQARLAIMAALISKPTLDFKGLKEITGTTDGNLSTHTIKLEEWGYLEIKKSFVGRRPHSTYTLTNKGREAFKKYVETLNNILKR